MQNFDYINKMLQGAIDSFKQEMLKGLADIPEGSLKDQCKRIMADMDKSIRNGDRKKLDQLRKELTELQKVKDNG